MKGKATAPTAMRPSTMTIRYSDMAPRVRESGRGWLFDPAHESNGKGDAGEIPGEILEAEVPPGPRIAHFLAHSQQERHAGGQGDGRLPIEYHTATAVAHLDGGEREGEVLELVLGEPAVGRRGRGGGHQRGLGDRVHHTGATQEEDEGQRRRGHALPTAAARASSTASSGPPA